MRRTHVADHDNNNTAAAANDDHDDDDTDHDLPRDEDDAVSAVRSSADRNAYWWHPVRGSRDVLIKNNGTELDKGRYKYYILYYIHHIDMKREKSRKGYNNKNINKVQP